MSTRYSSDMLVHLSQTGRECAQGKAGLNECVEVVDLTSYQKGQPYGELPNNQIRSRIGLRKKALQIDREAGYGKFAVLASGDAPSVLERGWVGEQGYKVDCLVLPPEFWITTTTELSQIVRQSKINRDKQKACATSILRTRTWVSTDNFDFNLEIDRARGGPCIVHMALNL